MYNNRQTGVEDGGKVPIGSNQVISGSNTSERAMFSSTQDTLQKVGCPICLRPQRW
jgi:hypothetical protein